MNTLVFVEHRDGAVKRPSLEVLGEARRMAGEHGGEVLGLVVGAGASQVAESLSSCGANKLIVIDDEAYQQATADAIAGDVTAAIDNHDIGFVLFSASALGRELSAYVAADKGVCVAADCTAVRRDGNKLVVERPIYAGKAVLAAELVGTPAIVSYRPNYGSPADGGPSPEVLSAQPSFTADALRARVVETTAEEGKKVDLTEAEIIVSGGRGMKGPENYDILESLAERIGGVVGASRAAVDSGWRPHADQVGQTGKTVSPKLYIACGISGAIQHLAGMSSSRCIVAINKDANAPIFQVADYGIVGDLFEVVPALSEELQKVL